MLEYRNEYKYICSEAELKIIEHRLRPIMKVDAHQSGNSYRIRSLYFDDYYRTAFNENEIGIDNRKKFRIRVYDNPKETIRLEVKYKSRGKTHKDSCKISQEVCEKIMAGERPDFDKNDPNPLKLLYIEMSMYDMKPVVVIEYERTAFTYPLGNVRVTLDRNISYSKDIGNFLEDRMNLTPIQSKGQHVLEVKYDEFIPDYIAQVLELGNLNRTAFSKFYLGELLKNK